ncbi:MAG: TlpA family protein disulfide reductase [Burkholderiaceae bacterium]|jgi:thiol-disulfide isomerase/thioredoxin|nr:TlpA family protein disulfide reductase [Burkholderiaceae bacterium]
MTETARVSRPFSGLPRRRAVLAWGACAGLCPVLARAASAPETLPVLQLTTLAGESVWPGGPDWRVLYLDFWASWCAPCERSFPFMNALHDRWSSRGLRIVAVGLDRQEADATRFLRRHPPRFAVALDPQAESARALAIKAMPTSLLVLREGRIAWTHRGFHSDDMPALERRIGAALE